jgi:chemosensory pili system protein ChpA (sensor histidine kinase/response regulator)
MTTQSATLIAASEEFDRLHDEFLALQAQMDSDQSTDAVDQYFMRLSLLAETASLLSLEGMAGCVEKLSENLMMIDPDEDVTEQLPGFFDWLLLAKNHIADPTATQPCIDWVNLLEDEAWPSPLDVRESRHLIDAFAKELVLDELEAQNEDAQYSIDELTTTITLGTDMEVLEAFLVDTPQQMESLYAIVSEFNFEKIQATTLGTLQAAQRISHTIKGSANLVGLTSVAWLAHELENYFEFLTEHCQNEPTIQLSFTDEAKDIVTASVDAMQAVLDSVENETADESGFQVWLAQLSAWSEWSYERAEVADDFINSAVKETQQNDLDPAEEPTPTQEHPPTVKTEGTKNPETDQHEWVELVEEMSINLAQSQELFKRVSNGLTELKVNDLRVQERRFELENAVDSRSMAQVSNTDLTEEFDSLELDRYDDIHRTAHQFIEAISDNREMVQGLQTQIASFDGLIRQQRRYTEQFQHQVLQSGQQPFSNLSSRLQRCVRQAARFTNKRVDLYIAGDDVRVDRTIVSALADPLMHLLRNAVDHGIEETRHEKPEQGRVELSFNIQQRAIEIQLKDDGAGVSKEHILEQAIERGMTLTDAQKSNPLQLLFAPGFTTRKEVTQLSGRGIGLDSVANDIHALEGQIKIESQPGSGTTFTLTIPLRQVTRHMIIISIGEQQYALDSTRIQQIIPPDESTAEQKGEQWVVNWQNDWIPFHDIHAKVGGENYGYKQGTLKHPLLLIEHQQKLCAIPIDSLQNSFDLVLKPLGQYVPNISGLFGMTQTGDGTLMPVLNLNELLDIGHVNASTHTSSAAPEVKQTVLVVDDSLSLRNSLKLLLADTGFQVQTATDGLDALEKIRIHKPSMMLVDMEMPRMNGLELTRTLRARADTQDMPIVMITSRSQAKHRQQAEAAGVNDYLTKPFNENHVVDTVHTMMVAASRTTMPTMEREVTL